MSKHGETKRSIIELLKGRERLPSDIARILNLSTSTVRQHLKDMIHIGLVAKANHGRYAGGEYAALY